MEGCGFPPFTDEPQLTDDQTPAGKSRSRRSRCCCDAFCTYGASCSLRVGAQARQVLVRIRRRHRSDPPAAARTPVPGRDIQTILLVHLLTAFLYLDARAGFLARLNDLEVRLGPSLLPLLARQSGQVQAVGGFLPIPGVVDQNSFDQVPNPEVKRDAKWPVHGWSMTRVGLRKEREEGKPTVYKPSSSGGRNFWKRFLSMAFM